MTLSAYRAVGGLPSRPLGEDAALALALEQSGFLIRHAMDVVVTTSCRFDSRAPGGAGHTMRARHENLEAECDSDLESVGRLFRRARAKGRLRHLHETGRLGDGAGWGPRLGIAGDRLATLMDDAAHLPFSRFWQAIEAESPALARGPALRPSDLPGEIVKADRLLRRLRLNSWSPADRAGTPARDAMRWSEGALASPR